MSVDDILIWAVSQFSNRSDNNNANANNNNTGQQATTTTQQTTTTTTTLVDVTSFGPSGLVIIHKLQTLHLLDNVPIITIDTLHLFNETYTFLDELRRRNDRSSSLFLQHNSNNTTIPIHIYKPYGYATRADFDDVHGKDLWKTNPNMYGRLTKVEPLFRALHDTNAKAWITGRRRSQGNERSQLQVLELMTTDDDNENNVEYRHDDKTNNNNGDHKKTNNNTRMSISPRYKINPLAFHWTYDDVWDYIRQHHLPYNPLHDVGYKSIGDYMSTIPVSQTSDERSGRFVGLSESNDGGSKRKRTECGLHSTRTKYKKMKQQQAQAQVAATIDETIGQKVFDEQFAVLSSSLSSCGGNNNNCIIDVTVETFDEVVLLNNNNNGGQSSTDKDNSTLLIEFYSPLCGACQEFASQFDDIATKLRPFRNKIRLARFDITEQDVPESGVNVGFNVQWTPSLFLVKRRRRERDDDPLTVIPYDGELQAKEVLKWIQNHVDNINVL